MSLFLCLSSISLGRYCRKGLAKSGGFTKNIKRGDSHKGGLFIEERFKPSAHYHNDRLKTGTWSPKLMRGPKLEGGPDLKEGASDPSSSHDILLA